MKRAAIISILLALVLLPGCISVPVKPKGRRGISWYRAERAISGDTIAVKGIGKVKYIGVAAPKRSISGKSGERFWKESLEKNRELVEGKWVRFELDLRRQDRLGRFLAYIFVQNEQNLMEEIFINGEMLRLGLARLEESTVNTKYIKRLEALENRARGQGLGIWSGR
jgi:endonuclease YncB( thermonuclease family)